MRAMTVSCFDACLVLQRMQYVMLPCAHFGPTPADYSGADMSKQVATSCTA